jgi:hypothetical protein
LAVLPYPGIVVFAVGGTIRLKEKLRVTNPFLTVLGQTAPGKGVAIAVDPSEKVNICFSFADQ